MPSESAPLTLNLQFLAPCHGQSMECDHLAKSLIVFPAEPFLRSSIYQSLDAHLLPENVAGLLPQYIYFLIF